LQRSGFCLPPSANSLSPSPRWASLANPNDYENECDSGPETWSSPDNSHLVRCVR
jgi:hypothetical protein